MYEKAAKMVNEKGESRVRGACRATLSELLRPIVLIVFDRTIAHCTLTSILN